MSNILEIEEYRHFCGHQELHTAINTLRGIVAGITIDNEVKQEELKELIGWCDYHRYLINYHPFSEIIPLIDEIKLGKEDFGEIAQDLLWMCNNFVSGTHFYDLITSSIQFLHGFIHGIMSDNVISNKEINDLRKWMDRNDFLVGVYPFDEIKDLLDKFLNDGIISQEERNNLKVFFSNFIDLRSSSNLNKEEIEELTSECSINNICTKCTQIEFLDNVFCFTGKSAKCSRKDIAQKIVDLGGVFKSGITKTTKFLIVGNDGNPCWTYSNYGRKIEEALAFKKQGQDISIINEDDFWAAINSY